MTPASRRALGWLPAALWMAVIFALSSQPSLPSPSQFNDKQAHAVTYGLLALLSLMGLTAWRWRPVAGVNLFAAFAITVVFGVSDEVHQSFVPGRNPDVADVLADAAGAAVATGGAWAWAILLARRSPVPRA